jgi:hypothetical protein
MNDQKQKTLLIMFFTAAALLLTVVAGVLPDLGLTRTSAMQNLFFRWTFPAESVLAVFTLVQMRSWQARRIVKAAVIIFFILVLLLTLSWFIFIHIGGV